MMEFYAGLDVSLEATNVCVVTVCGVKPVKRKSREHLAHDRPAGPQAHPARVAASLAPRTGPPMDHRNDLRTNPPALTRRPFSSTQKLVSRVRLQ
jgi:hypothetical protein